MRVAYVAAWTAIFNGFGGKGGIHSFEILASGEWQPLEWLDADVNAGYLCVSPDQRRLYVVDERKNSGPTGTGGGQIVTYDIDAATGLLTRTATVASGGAFPAYVAVNRSGAKVATINHGSYDFTLRLRDGELQADYDATTMTIYDTHDGAVNQPGVLVELAAGHGPLVGRDVMLQQSSHPHSVVFDPSGAFAVVCDKGTDHIYVYRVDDAPTLASTTASAPGRAPRHSAFHPTSPWLYVVNERESLLDAYRFGRENGSLDLIASYSTIPPDYAAVNHPAEIAVHPSGRFVYASNRGHDSIAVFAIDQASGALSLVEITASGGQTPRGFRIAPEGSALFAANQDSNEIVRFAIDQQSGSLSDPTVVAHLERPECIQFADF